jgi:hypothetical protein
MDLNSSPNLPPRIFATLRIWPVFRFLLSSPPARDGMGDVALYASFTPNPRK